MNRWILRLFTLLFAVTPLLSLAEGGAVPPVPGISKNLADTGHAIVEGATELGKGVAEVADAIYQALPTPLKVSGWMLKGARTFQELAHILYKNKPLLVFAIGALGYMEYRDGIISWPLRKFCQMLWSRRPARDGRPGAYSMLNIFNIKQKPA